MRLPPLSVLCLHGYTQSGSIMRAQTRRVAERSSARVRFTFVDAPFSAGDGHAWWVPERDESGGWIYNGVDEALGVLAEAEAAERRVHGSGFAGVLGFSQGGALASLAVALHEHERLGRPAGPDAPAPPLPKLGFALFAGAFAYRAAAPSYARLIDSVSPMCLPSLHCVGARDKFVRPERSEHLEALFREGDGRVSVRHRAGHVVPSDDASLDAVDAFLLRRQRAELAGLAAEFGNGTYC